jgi:glutamine synthetase adenylyltransferase
MHHYARVARRFTEAMSTLTEEGYLYRVDLRLRPDGKAGPIVNSDAALRVYYEHRGRPWEFQALLKARAIAGDFSSEIACSRISQVDLQPGASYSPLETVGAMRDQIKDHAHTQRGYNVKLMAGGIATSSSSRRRCRSSTRRSITSCAHPTRWWPSRASASSA